MNEDTVFGCFIAAIVLVVIGVAVLPINITTRTGGVHKGYITAVEEEVFLDNTATVYVKTDLSSSQEDKYCINRSDTQLLEQAKKAANDKTNVTIHYSGIELQGLFRCGGDTIQSIE